MEFTGKFKRKGGVEWSSALEGKTYELVWVQQKGTEEIRENEKTM